MNQFASVGNIVDVKSDGKHLKFTLSIYQKKPCLIPCVIFYPKVGDSDYLKELLSSKLTIWLQGSLINYQINLHGSRITIIEVLTSFYGIKELKKS
jgi:hypothetical protein